MKCSQCKVKSNILFGYKMLYSNTSSEKKIYRIICLNCLHLSFFTYKENNDLIIEINRILRYPSLIYEFDPKPVFYYSNKSKILLLKSDSNVSSVLKRNHANEDIVYNFLYNVEQSYYKIS